MYLVNPIPLLAWSVPCTKLCVYLVNPIPLLLAKAQGALWVVQRVTKA